MPPIPTTDRAQPASGAVRTTGRRVHRTPTRGRGRIRRRVLPPGGRRRRRSGGPARRAAACAALPRPRCRPNRTPGTRHRHPRGRDRPPGAAASRSEWTARIDAVREVRPHVIAPQQVGKELRALVGRRRDLHYAVAGAASPRWPRARGGGAGPCRRTTPTAQPPPRSLERLHMCRLPAVRGARRWPWRTSAHRGGRCASEHRHLVTAASRPGRWTAGRSARTARGADRCSRRSSCGTGRPPARRCPQRSRRWSGSAD